MWWRARKRTAPASYSAAQAGWYWLAPGLVAAGSSRAVGVAAAASPAATRAVPLPAASSVSGPPRQACAARSRASIPEQEGLPGQSAVLCSLCCTRSEVGWSGAAARSGGTVGGGAALADGSGRGCAANMATLQEVHKTKMQMSARRAERVQASAWSISQYTRLVRAEQRALAKQLLHALGTGYMQREGLKSVCRGGGG